MATIYRNATWIKRNYDCTNVVYQTAPAGEAPRRANGDAAPADEWVPADAVPSEMIHLYTVNGFKFYGFV